MPIKNILVQQKMSTVFIAKCSSISINNSQQYLPSMPAVITMARVGQSIASACLCVYLSML